MLLKTQAVNSSAIGGGVAIANSTAATSAGSRRWLLVALLFVLFRALPNISYPIGRDQATYSVIGEGLLNGQRLYRDLWDNKPPGIFAVYALLAKLFHHVMWSVGLVDILWLLAISYCIFRFAERYLGPAAAAIAACVNADWHCRFGYTDAGQTECFLMLLVFAGYFAVAGDGRRPLARHFAAGLCLGGAFWLKYNALAFLPLLALLPCLDWSRFDARPRRLGLLVARRALFSRVAALLAGFSIVVAVVLGYFYLVGSWPSLKEVQFEVLPRYAAMAERTSRYWQMAAARVVLYLGLWTWVATGLAFLLAESRDLSRLTPVLIAAAVGFVCTASQVRFTALSFETCFPFFAMIWGYLVVKTYVEVSAAARSPAAGRRALARTAAIVLVGITLFWPLRAEVKAVWQRYRDLGAWRRNRDAFFVNYPAMRFLVENLGGQMQVIQALRQVSSPGDGVFVWGTDPLIYYLTGRRPPTRFLSNIFLMGPWSPPAWREELVHDLGKSPPAFIVVAQHDNFGITLTPLDSEQYLSVYPSLAHFISASYDFMAEFPDFVIYRRKPGP
jgi:hypothetical protein